MYQPTNGLTGMDTLKQWDTATFGGLTDAAIDYWVDKSEEELKGVVHMPSFDISFSDKINQYLITKGKITFLLNFIYDIYYFMRRGQKSIQRW